ncbi:MAG: extracellular solute-binding protein [Anaerolineae bacterium]|jgi:ABC-type glycerol-3-phosphate transport system substrate-binding protein
MGSRKLARRTVLRAFTAGLTGLAGASLLASCGATPAPATAPEGAATTEPVQQTSGGPTGEKFKIELLVEYPQEFVDWAKQNLEPKIQEEYPVSEVVYVPIDWGTLNEKLLTTRAAGTMPDIVRGGSGGPAGYVEGDFIIPVDDYVAQWPEQADFFEASWQGVVWEGKQWGIPMLGGPRHWAYRSDITDEEGVTIPDDWDWDDYMEAAIALTVFEGNKIVRKGSSTGHDEMEWTGLLYSAGGSLFKDGRANFVSDEGIWALEWMAKRRNEVAPAGMAPLESMEIPYFAMGLEVIGYGHPGLLGYNVLQYAPDKIDFVAVPQPPINKTRVALVSTDWDAISKTCRHPDAAWRYMTLQASVEAMTVAQEAFGGFPPTRRGVLEVAEYCKRADVIKVSENLDKFGLTYPTVPKASLLRRKILLAECEAACLGVKTAEQALTDAAAEWDKELEAMGWSATW